MKTLTTIILLACQIFVSYVYQKTLDSMHSRETKMKENIIPV